MSWKLNEAKNFHKKFHDVLERVVEAEIKCHITFFCEQIELRVTPKKEVEKPRVFVFDLEISTNKDRVSTPGKSGNLLEDQEKSGKFDIFWEKSAKSKGRKFLSMQFFNCMHAEMCAVELYMTISCTYDAIICIWY